MRARFDAHVVKAASTPILSEQSFIPTRIREEAVMSQRTDVRRSVVAPSPTEATEATTSFVNLGVSRPVADALRMRGIAEAFPIQSLVLQDAIAGRDVLARSSTGSGKTLAFAVPIVERLTPGGGSPNALILARVSWRARSRRSSARSPT